MITKIDLSEYPGYYFLYDPDNPSIPIKFYTMWKQYGNKYRLTTDVHTEVKQHLNCGYSRVHLRDSNKNRKIIRVHNIIAKCLIENPFNLDTVDHIDNNKSNNHPSNLQWLSFSYNSKKNALTNEKSAARAKSYEIHFKDGRIKVVYCLKDFSRDSNGFYSYYSLCALTRNNSKNKSHKDIINIKRL
jgi:hypothetical protein